MKGTESYSTKIVIIGAGAGGASTALSLAKLGYSVVLLEARSEVGIISTKEEKRNQKSVSTSWINPGRAGHGFHYIDLNTGKMLMESTIGIYRKYPALPIGGMYAESHPLRKGRYFITKDSIFPKEEILKVYSQLQEHYRWLIQKDPKNQVLGHPDDFFRVLKQNEYEQFVNSEYVKVGIETTERLINPALLAQTLFQEVKEEKNITLLMGKRVTQVRYGQDKPFIVVLHDGSSIDADHVINCAWENMEAIDQTLGLFDASVKCTNRLKVLAVVKLPVELQDQHSMFFCMGAFCMFSNVGDGTGLMTYAPITNIANYSDSKIDEAGKKFLSGSASPEEVKYYGNSIIQGASRWIPAIAKAELITVRFGIVKTYGDVDIFDPLSKVHSRDYFGVDSKQIGYIDNACMKLMNLIENAKLVETLFARHVKAEEKIKLLSQNIAQSSTTEFPGLLKLFLAHYLRRQYSPQDFSSEEKIKILEDKYIDNIKKKNALHTEFLSIARDARLMLINLYLNKILPVVLTSMIANYCEEIRQPIIGKSAHTLVNLFIPVSVSVSVKPLARTSQDDSAPKPRKITDITLSYSSNSLVLSNQKNNLLSSHHVSQKDGSDSCTAYIR